MIFGDFLLMCLILSSAGYLLYRSLFKKKGCSGCVVNSCPVKALNKKLLVK